VELMRSCGNISHQYNQRWCGVKDSPTPPHFPTYPNETIAGTIRRRLKLQNGRRRNQSRYPELPKFAPWETESICVAAQSSKAQSCGELSVQGKMTRSDT